MSIEFHVGMLPTIPSYKCLDIALKTEQLDFNGVWLADSHSVFRDAYALLAAVAVKTETLKLGAAVTQTVTRHPGVLANSCSTLDELSNGRCILGIGVGDSSVVNLGMKPEKLADFEEKINVIRALIQGETVNYRDTEIKSAWADRRIPIIMACSGPKSLKLGAKIADGILYQVAESFNGDAIFVCGIGSGQENRGFEQAVGQLIDGVFYGRCCLSRLSYPDIAQVEILRGPQRAVIGKNTTAGAINIRTVQPTGEFEAWVTPTYELEGAKGFNIGEPLWVQTHKLLTT